MNLTIVLLPIRALQALFAIIVLGLTGYVAHWSHKYGLNSPSQINFLIFVSIWTFLSLIYLLLVPRFLSMAAKPYALLAVEALTTVFWFAGFIALAVAIDKFECAGHVCGAAKAAAVFGGFEWLLWMATLILQALSVFRGDASGPKGTNGVSSGTYDNGV